MSANERMIGRIEELTTKQRRTLRMRARAQRRVAMGIQLCGAKTRSGRPCIAKAIKYGRCKNHGGASTGPKTEEGRQRQIEGLRRANARREAEAAQRRIKGEP